MANMTDVIPVCSLNQALQNEASKVVFGDVPNFTDAQPTLIKGIVQASNTL